METDVEVMRRKKFERRRKGNGTSRTLNADKDIRDIERSKGETISQNRSGEEFDARKIIPKGRGGVRKGAGRKPKDASSTQITKPAKPQTDINILDETGKIYQIYRMLVYEAKNFDQIAVELNVAPGEIRKYIQKACERMNVEVEHMKESWLSMVLLQSNAVLGTLMPAILAASNKDDEGNLGEPDHRSIQSWVNVTKVNLEVINMMTVPKMPNIQAGQVIVQQNNAFVPTMSGTSKLYELGVQDMMDGKNIGSNERLEELVYGSAKKVDQIASAVGIPED